jgi:hypothetical protein
MCARLVAVGVMMIASFAGGCAQSRSPTVPPSALSVPSSTGTVKAASVTIVPIP